MQSADQNVYLRELFDYLEPGVLIADDRAVYVDANRSACKLLGRSRAEIVGHHLSEFIEGARAPEVDVQWKAFLRDGSQSGVFAIQKPDGSAGMLKFQATANFVPGLHCSFVTDFTTPAASAGQPEFTTICAWTKRVLFEKRWVSVEDYLLLAHGLVVTHGICPEAFTANFQPDAEAMRKRLRSVIPQP